MGNTNCSTWCGKNENQDEIMHFETVHQPIKNMQQSVKNLKFNTPEETPDVEENEFGIKSFEWEQNKPEENYSIVISVEDMEFKYQPTRAMKKFKSKLQTWIVRQKRILEKLPKSEDFYYIPSLQIIYQGQWKNGKPFGHGNISYLQERPANLKLSQFSQISSQNASPFKGLLEGNTNQPLQDIPEIIPNDDGEKQQKNEQIILIIDEKNEIENQQQQKQQKDQQKERGLLNQNPQDGEKQFQQQEHEVQNYQNQPKNDQTEVKNDQKEGNSDQNEAKNDQTETKNGLSEVKNETKDAIIKDDTQLLNNDNKRINEENKEIQQKDDQGLLITNQGNIIEDPTIKTERQTQNLQEIEIQNNKQVNPDLMVVSIYEGSVRDGKATGRGRFLNIKLYLYEGMFKDDKFEGKGFFRKPDGFFYKGIFKNNLPDGTGTESFPNGSSYTGEYSKGKKNGKGSIRIVIQREGDPDSTSNEYYEGMFKDNQFHGKGKYKQADSTQYEGDFINNKMNGFGVLSYTNGNIYQGQFKDDQKNGFGKFQLNNGIEYQTEWVLNKIQGFGLIKINNKEIYGEWVDSKMISCYYQREYNEDEFNKNKKKFTKAYNKALKKKFTELQEQIGYERLQSKISLKSLNTQNFSEQQQILVNDPLKQPQIDQNVVNIAQNDDKSQQKQPPQEQISEDKQNKGQMVNQKQEQELDEDFKNQTYDVAAKARIAKIQAVQRGKQARKEIQKQQQEEKDKIQVNDQKNPLDDKIKNENQNKNYQDTKEAYEKSNNQKNDNDQINSQKIEVKGGKVEQKISAEIDTQQLEQYKEQSMSQLQPNQIKEIQSSEKDPKIPEQQKEQSPNQIKVNNSSEKQLNQPGQQKKLSISQLKSIDIQNEQAPESNISKIQDQPIQKIEKKQIEGKQQQQEEQIQQNIQGNQEIKIQDQKSDKDASKYDLDVKSNTLQKI